MKFKLGDKIVCINSENHTHLELGKLYTVATYDPASTPNGDYRISLHELANNAIRSYEWRFLPYSKLAVEIYGQVK